MSEKNILAFFKSPDLAQRVANQLQELGIKDMNIDRFKKYPGYGPDRLMSPVTGEIQSEAAMVLGLEATGDDSGILLNADVSASGMSDGGNDVVTGHDILLTVVVDESMHHQALDLIRRAGGVV